MRLRIPLSLALAAALGLALPAHARNGSDEFARQAMATSPVGNYLAGRVAADLRDTAAASVYLRSALRADPRNAELLDRTFRIVLANGDVDEATELAERVLQTDNQNRLARLTLAVRAVKNRQFVTARSQLSQAMRNPMADVVATLVTAWSWQGSGDAKKALEVADRLTGNELSDLFRDLHSGLMAEAAGMTREADRRLARAYQLDQSSFVVVDAYARHLARAGKTDEALKTYRALAANMQRNNRIAEAIADLEKGEKPEPVAKNAREGVAEALFSFGQLANRSESAEIALIYLNLALYLTPEHELALLTLADLYETLQQPDRAIAVYEQLPHESPFHQDAEIRVALNLALANKMDDAIKRMDELVRERPKDADVIVSMGNLLHRDKRYPRAAEMFGRAIALLKEPKASDWSLYFARGVAYDAAKEWPKAEADLVMANKLSPDQPVVLNYLGYSWVDRGLHLDRAIDMIRKAVELRPNDGDIVDSLGWAYYRLGRFEDAKVQLERAIELKPQSWEINDHLGDVYWKVGRQLEAKFQWLHALSLELEPDKRAIIERKLNEGLEPVEKELDAKRAAERSSIIPAPSDQGATRL